MQPHEETAIRAQLRGLSPQQLSNIKAHAKAANHEEHHSFKEIAKWVAAVLGTVPTVGLVWKVIKIILEH